MYGTLTEPFAVESAARGVSDSLLGRGAARRHALSVQVALGASRWRLVRPFLVESALLSLLGASLGTAFAGWAARAMVSQFPSFEVPIVLDLGVDLRVLGYTAVVGVATAMISGLVPALWATTVDPLDALKADRRSGGGDGRVRGFSVLLVAQVAVSLLLLVAAGLFGRTLYELTHVALRVRCRPPPRGDGADAGHAARLPERSPASVGAGGCVRSRGRCRRRRGPSPAPVHLSGLPPPAVRRRAVAEPGSADVSGLGHAKVVRGVRDADARGTPYCGAGCGWSPGGNGRQRSLRATFPSRSEPGGTAVEDDVRVPGGEFTLDPKAVVGIVGDAVHESVRGPVRPIVYVPMAQEPMQSIFVAVASIAVRSDFASPEHLSRGVATALARVDPDVRVSFLTGTEILGFALARDRLVARLAGFAGLLGLLLTALVLGGVTAYRVTRVRSELAVRLALGSTQRRLVGLVLSGVLRSVVGGVTVGLGFSLWTSRTAESMLFGVESWDPVVLAGASVTLVVVGVLAGWVPAYRASRLNPGRALTES